MATVTRNPINVRFPFELRDQPPEVVQAHRYAFQGIVDLQQAIAVQAGQIKAIVAKSTPSAASSTTTNTIETVTIEDILTGLGSVNDKTGSTTYTTQTSDAGALLILNDASPVAVTLNSIVTPPFACFVTNFGAGLVTLTPTSGTINGGSTLSLLQNQSIWLVFDGTNWKSDALFAPPLNTPAVSHQFITAFAAATGAFSQAQPAFTDISGQITTAQLPASGVTHVVPLGSFTVGGTTGSITVTNGIITAFVDPT